MRKILELSQKFKNIATSIKEDVAIEALNHYKDKFVVGGDNWESQKWVEPKRKTEGPKKYKVVDKNGKALKKRSGYLKGFKPRDAKRATLVGKGVLSRSLKYRIEEAKIVFYSNVSYAKRHNNGEKMPKRQFLGMEKSLRVKIVKVIKDNLDKL